MSNVVSLDDVRARLLPTPFVRPQDVLPQPPQAIIQAAADLWICDSIRAASDELIARITQTNAPLSPNQRRAAMRASAALLQQPEGP